MMVDRAEMLLPMLSAFLDLPTHINQGAAASS
jgi:hypothetical protein